MKWLVIDVSNLGYRAMHTTGYLEYEGRPTGTLFGIYTTCRALQQRFLTENFVFCFDSRYPRRKVLYPQYKNKEKKDGELEDPMKTADRLSMYQQLKELWYLLTQEMQVPNVFGATGMEADDLIASVVRSNPDEEFVVVSSDEDLYQLLSPTVVQYKPITKVVYDERLFGKEYPGLMPSQWASVKAWAGCTSDNIKGLPGIGEKRASQFLLGKFSKPERFTDNLDVYNRNIRLTKLPFEGTPALKLTPQAGPLDWSPLLRWIGSAEALIPGVRNE